MHCPKCGLRYPDSSQRFCDADGTRLVPDPSSGIRQTGVFSTVLASLHSEKARKDELKQTAAPEIPSGSSVIELENDLIKRDDEVIHDDEIAELFKLGTEQDRTYRKHSEETPALRTAEKPRELPADDDALLELADAEPSRGTLAADSEEPILAAVDDKPRAEMTRPVVILKPAADEPVEHRPAVHQVDPSNIPLGHVDLDERHRSTAHLNDFMADAPALFVGKTVKGRYRVFEMVGEDDSGFVFLAEDRIGGAKRVVVRILAEYEGDEITAEILADERVRLSHLNHPNVARVFDSGEFTSGYKFLVSEHPDGLTAEDILAIHGKLDPARAAKAVRQAAAVLGDVHKHGILHRDIRPANIEIAGGDGEAAMKIINFGVANGEPTDQNLMYCAPEVIDGGINSVSSDIYALGVTAYRLLTGKYPFSGTNSKEIIQSKKKGFKGGLNGSLNDIFVRALSPDPRSRYTTPREFGDAFAAVAANAVDVLTPSAKPAAASVIEGSSPVVEKTIAVEPTSEAAKANDNDPAWTRRSPEPPQEPNGVWLKRAGILFLAFAVIFAIAWYYLIKNQPATTEYIPPKADANANANYDPTETPPAPRKLDVPPNWTRFNNNKANLRGDLSRNFVEFSIAYPQTWKVLGPVESPDRVIRGKFIDLSKLNQSGELQEEMLVSYYPSRGTYSDDASNFPALVKESTDTLSKLIPGLQIISEGKVTFNQGWTAYQVRFQGSGPTKDGKMLTVWGKRLYVPAARPGVKNGFEITMLATSNSTDVTNIDDVGTKGDLQEILTSFEPGTNF